MTFTVFAQHLRKIEKTSSRLEMTELLAKLFEELDPEEIPPAIYLSLGRLVPQHQSLEFQLSEKMVMRSIAKHLARHPDLYGENLPVGNLFAENDEHLFADKVKKLYKQIGDIGEVAEQLFEKSYRKNLEPSLLEIHQELSKVAAAEGQGSQERKVDGLLAVFEKLDPVSIRFVGRIVVGKLRLGFSTMTILDALSWVKHADKSASKQLEELFQRKADLGLLAQMYLGDKYDLEDLKEKYQVSLGIPVMPALCQRLNSAEEIIEKMGEVIVEPKYDGLRIQIHLGKDKDGKRWVRSFTRNLEETSHMFPELERALDEFDLETGILDGEVVGVDKKTGSILSFQQTATRRRKHGVEEKAEEIPVKFFLFDVLMKDGGGLLDKPLTERKKILKKIVPDSETFVNTPYSITSDPEELQKFHIEQLAQGLEGAVIKNPNSRYKSGRKGWRWVKIKEEEGATGKLSDTLDCIVMGYYRGRGKRASFGLGAFLVGLLGDDEQIYTVAKIGTGLTDDQFKELKNRLDKLEVDDKPTQYDLDKNLNPDIWVKPDLVVEIAADELTKSPIHTAGKALRFPRLVRFRDDKNWEQATTVKELADIKIS
jgi:DNA ligase-1